jgi:nucleoside-diphosphate-sugar epimerase
MMAILVTGGDEFIGSNFVLISSAIMTSLLKAEG